MLHVHRAERADRLAAALAGILAAPLADPFAPEVVAVPTRGIERWLTQVLSSRLGASAGRGDGVCAGIGFPSPARLIAGALAAATGIDPDRDPWAPERMTWKLLETVDANLDEPWLAPLAAHLAAGRERRFVRVRALAALYHHYSVRRPGLIEAWAAGDGDGWQPDLWRALRARIGVASGAERLAPACAALGERPELAALPERFALFGLTRLPAGHVLALRALAAHRDVHLLLLHPSPALWDKVARLAAGMPPAAGAPGPPPRRAHDATARLPANRLLASWGRESRELQLVLAAHARDDHVAEHHHAVEAAAPRTVLEALQAAIRADLPAPGPPLPGEADGRLELAAGDLSVAVHACHGRRRQVEVVREAILHRLAADPSLEPRDVIVMCPDIETFAPLIGAVFGTGAAADPDRDAADPDLDAEPEAIDLRVRIADRSLRQTNPVLAVVSRLLDLAHSRLTASEVLDLTDTEPVRRRFALDDEELARIREWVAAGAIHWGLDAEHRQAFKLGGVEAGTWDHGLRRLLLGVAMSEAGGRLYEGVLPLDDVDSGAIDLAGRFAELLDRLATAVRALRGPHTVKAWVEALESAADALTAVAERDAWQRLELSRLLGEVVIEAAGSAASTRLTLAETRALLAQRLRGRPTRASFRTGHLTVCTLQPMRSVPHRIVCLLGLDDGAFPRHAPRNGDDLLLADPHVGDRDPRAEDRQLMLDALLAAREALIVTYSGRDERTGAPRPPAVPVGELLDAVDATARCPDGGSARRRVLVEHPLQPFDPRNFDASEPAGGEPWSFDRLALAGARALQRERVPEPPFLAAPLPPATQDGTLALADLVTFVERPVRAFLRQRLGIWATAAEDQLSDALPVELDALDRWGVGQRLLDGLLAGRDRREVALAEVARGTLPPGALGQPVIRDVWPQAEAIVERARTFAPGGGPRSLEVGVTLPGGARLLGTVPGVRGEVLLGVGFSRLGPRQRLASWVRLLALTAAHPDLTLEAVTIGRGPGRGGPAVAVARIPALGRDAAARREVALAELAVLADLHERGLREPLPLPCLTAAAYAAAGRSGHDAVAAAGETWSRSGAIGGENREPEHLLAFGRELSLEELLAFPPRDGEDREGWHTGQPSRFARLALRLWTPLLAREVLDP